MEERKKFNPSEHLMKLKGKDYLQVMWRLVWFRGEHPDWCIGTELVSHGDNSAVFVARIYDHEGVQLATGYGSETAQDFRDYLEKAETKAVGRALAMLGYGTQFTSDELDEGERVVDSPVERSQTKPSKFDLPPASAVSPQYICADCGREIRDGTKGGAIWPAADIAKSAKEEFGRALCIECVKKALRAARRQAAESGEAAAS